MSRKRRPSQLNPSYVADWNDLEQAFFESAPPDEPEPPAEPARFDDLFPDELARPHGKAALRRALAAARRFVASLAGARAPGDDGRA